MKGKPATTDCGEKFCQVLFLPWGFEWARSHCVHGCAQVIGTFTTMAINSNQPHYLGFQTRYGVPGANIWGGYLPRAYKAWT